MTGGVSPFQETSTYVATSSSSQVFAGQSLPTISQLQRLGGWTFTDMHRYEAFHSHGATPKWIHRWLVYFRENPIVRNGWSRGTPWLRKPSHMMWALIIVGSQIKGAPCRAHFWGDVAGGSNHPMFCSTDHPQKVSWWCDSHIHIHTEYLIIWLFDYLIIWYVLTFLKSYTQGEESRASVPPADMQHALSLGCKGAANGYMIPGWSLQEDLNFRWMFLPRFYPMFMDFPWIFHGFSYALTSVQRQLCDAFSWSSSPNVGMIQGRCCTCSKRWDSDLPALGMESLAISAKASLVVRCCYGGFLSHRDTPCHHPFIDGIFHMNHPILGYPHLWKPLYQFVINIESVWNIEQNVVPCCPSDHSNKISSNVA